VRLERLTRGHVPGLAASTCGAGTEPAWTYLSQGPLADAVSLTAYLEPMWASPDWLPLAIVPAATGEAQGMAAYLRMRLDVGAIEVGAILFGPDLARTRGATEAMYLMARHVFDDLGYRRYEWKCDALNSASRRAAQRLGFSYEGTWRNAVVYKGRSRDTAWFAMTDEDWTRLRPLYDEWLATAREDGQAQSLSAMTLPFLHTTDPALS
jgi:RimJ/RimL family protein N-acetyltransferase